MHRKWLTLIVVLTLLAAMLSGCSFKNKVLDAQMEAALVHLNNGDAEAMYQLMYPDAIEEQAFSEGFDLIMQIWQEKQPDDLKLVRFYVDAKAQADFRQKTYEGFYKTTFGEEIRYIYLRYADTSEGSGIVNLNILAENEVSGVEVSTESIVSLISEGIFLLIAVITIIDVIRKKPRRYGWFIVLAMLRSSFTSGGMTIVIPVGAMIYWGIRSKLLRKKAEWLKAQQSEEEHQDEPAQE